MNNVLLWLSTFLSRSPVWFFVIVSFYPYYYFHLNIGHSFGSCFNIFIHCSIISVSVIFFSTDKLLMVMGHCVAFLLLHYRLARFSGSKCHTSELCDINLGPLLRIS